MKLIYLLGRLGGTRGTGGLWRLVYRAFEGDRTSIILLIAIGVSITLLVLAYYRENR